MRGASYRVPRGGTYSTWYSHLVIRALMTQHFIPTNPRNNKVRFNNVRKYSAYFDSAFVH